MEKLCMPFDPLQQYGIVYARNLPFDGLLSIQPFTDDAMRLLVFDWVKREFIKGLWPVDPVAPHIFSDMLAEKLESDFAQALLGHIDGEPAFLLEVSCEYRSGENEVTLFLPDDYVMQLLIRHDLQADHELCLLIIAFCVEFIFSYGEVNRLFVQTDLKKHPLASLYKEAGFVFEQNIKQRGEAFSLLKMDR
ncbi:MAG: GNAT family N-acetyltransferase [Chitinophagaceae bacterium]